jgi:hypothetical protein
MPNLLLPEVKDPVIAVVLERIERLNAEIDDDRHERRQDLADYRAGQTKKLDELGAEIKEIKADQARMNKFVTRAEGGYLLIIGAMGVASSILLLWDKLKALWPWK